MTSDAFKLPEMGWSRVVERYVNFLITQFHTASRRVVPISSRRERSHLVTRAS
jgi:hypothetical protein